MQTKMNPKNNNNKSKTKFNFCNIGQDIWLSVDKIRNNDMEASEIGKNITNNNEKWTEYESTLTYVKNKDLQSKIQNSKPVNNINNIEIINLEHKPLLQILGKLGNQETIVTIDDGAQRTLMHPNNFNKVKKKLKVIETPKDSTLHSVNGQTLKEEGRYIIKNAISFSKDQIPEDLHVIVTPETPYPILLGLPQLRKWNSHIIHSEDLSRELLIFDGYTKNSPAIKRKIHATAIPKYNKNENYISLCLQKDIKILPLSGKAIPLSYDCPIEDLRNATLEINTETIINVSPTIDKEEWDLGEILMDINYKRGPHPYIEMEIINNTENAISLSKNDIVGIATIDSHLSNKTNDEKENTHKELTLRKGSIIQDIGSLEKYLVKSVDDQQCIITSTDNVYIINKEEDKSLIQLGIKPEAKYYHLPKHEIKEVQTTNDNGVQNILIESISNINSLPEEAKETETEKNTDEIRKKLLSAVTIGNFGTDPKIRQRTQEILWKYRFLFSKDRMDIGRIKKDFFTHDVTPLKTMPATKRFPPFRFNAEEKLIVEKYMKMLEKAGVQKPNQPSPYSLPCFLIDKADELPTFEHNETKNCKTDKEESNKLSTAKQNKTQQEQDERKSETINERTNQTDKLEVKTIKIKDDGNCLFNAIKESYKYQFPKKEELPDVAYFRQNVSELGKLIASEEIQAAVKMKKEDIINEWDRIKIDGVWWTQSPVADVVLPTISQYMEQPFLVIQDDKIWSINGVEALEQPPNCINEQPLIILRNKDKNHYEAVIPKYKDIWDNISKAMISKEISMIEKKMVHNLYPDDFSAEYENNVPQEKSKDINHTKNYKDKKDKPKRAKRVLIDARFANKHIEMQVANLPVIEELLESFSYPNVVTGSIDLTQFYWQIPVTERYGKIFTVSTHLGTHTPQVVQQGDMCAVRAAQETTKKIIKDIPGVSALIDDICITAPTPTEFLNRFEKVLERLENCADPEFGPGIKIRGDKCVILSDNINYMGFKIVKGQLIADKKKAEKILNWKIPENLTDLQSYCSFISYFRIFFRNASLKIQPILELEKLQKYKKEEHWTEEHQSIFDEVKKILTNLPTLKIIDTSPNAGKLHIHHDWSVKGYGALLSQETIDDETGKISLRPIQYFSRLAKKSELRYKVSEGEMNSAIAAIQKWSHYLRGKQFILHSDSSVVYHVLKNYKNTSRVLGRLAAVIQGMCFKVKHISTKENPADYFSRLVVTEERICNTDKKEPNIPKLSNNGDVILNEEEYETDIYDGDDIFESEDEQENEDEVSTVKENIKQTSENDERNKILQEIKTSIKRIQPILDNHQNNKNSEYISVVTRNQNEIGDVLEDIPELHQKQREDLYLLEIINHLQKIKSKNATYKHHRYTYKLVSGILLAKYDEGPYRYVAPHSMRREIVVAKHGLVHCGVEKTEQLIRSVWIFPGLDSLVRKIVKSCYRCQAFGSNPKVPYNKHNPLQHLKASKPLETIAIDVWSSGKQNSRYKYVICAIDLFSRFCWSKCITRATSDVISDFLIENVFTTGIPSRILSDNAENISAGSLPHLYNAINIGFKYIKENENPMDMEEADTARITQTTSTAYWPMSNSVIERIFRNFGDWIRKVVTTNPEEFYKIIPVATLVYNTTNHRALGTSPAHIHFGIKPEESMPDIYQLLANGGYNSPNHYIRERAEDCKKAREDALHFMNKNGGYYKRMEDQFNERNDARWHSYQLGDWVMVYRPPDNKQKLGSPYYMGPATIIELVGRSCVIIEYWSNGVKKRRNVKHLKNFFYDPEDKEAHRLFSGPKKPDIRLNADGHPIQNLEDPFPEDNMPEDDISFGLQDESRLPIILDGEQEDAEDDDIDEDDDDQHQVTFKE